MLGIDEYVSYKKLEIKIENLIQKYNLALDLDAPVISLSSGQKQKVEIVRVLLQNPKILVMDEPTSYCLHKRLKICL